jgi:hypothetical protein
MANKTKGGGFLLPDLGKWRGERRKGKGTDDDGTLSRASSISIATTVGEAITSSSACRRTRSEWK